MKICVACGVEKPLDMFEKQKNRPSHRKKCKQCRYSERDLEKERLRHREYAREKRKECPDTIRRNWERAKYGACKEDLGHTECLICGSTRRLCIDHDHQDGQIRGLLCSKCNLGLGCFDDDPIILAKAIQYLVR